MSKPTGVSNTSPLVIFAKSGNLDLLLKLFQKPLVIEEAVYQEAVVQGIEKQENDAEIIEKHVKNKEILVKKANRILDLPYMDAGERAAISLAVEEKPDFVCMDDLEGRAAAKQLGLKPVGCIGILTALLKLKIIGKRKALEIVEEMVNAGYRISAKLLEGFKKAVKENKDFLP